MSGNPFERDRTHEDADPTLEARLRSEGRGRRVSPPKTKVDRIARLRNRLDNARTERDLRDVLKGVLDLLADEL